MKAWFNNLPIKKKLLLIALISLGSAMLLASLALTSIEFFSARQRLLQDTQMIARVLGENSSAALIFQDQKAAHDLLHSLRLHPEITYAALYLPDGQQFAVHRRDDGTLIRDVPHTPPKTIPSYTLGWRELELFEPILLPNQSTAVIGLHVSLDLRYQRLLEFIGTVTFITLFALFVAMWVLHVLQQAITEPLLELTNLMHMVADHQDYTQRTTIIRNDEIGLLAQGFNTMLEFMEQHHTGLKKELRAKEDSNRHLNQLAHYDVLTGLPNRYYFNNCLESFVETARNSGASFGLMFIDLDGFKPVNDTFGHHTGDLLLRGVAHRLMGCVRKGDVVCRIGGDEFAVLLETLADREQASIIAEKVIRTLAQPFKLEGQRVQIGSSIGISLCPDDAKDCMALLHYADLAMYQAKQSGKGRYQYFYPGLDD